MKITLVKGIGFIINLVWTGGGQGVAEGQAQTCLFWPEKGPPKDEHLGGWER